MGKITFLRATGLFLLTALLCTDSLQANGQIENEPRPPRFKVEISGGFDHSITSLTGNHSTITGKDGVVASDLTAGKEDLRRLNRENTYKLMQQTVDLRLSYRVWDKLSVWVGVGVVSTSGNNRYPGTDELQSKTASENPELILKGGLNYLRPLCHGFFVAIRPSVGYSHTNSLLLTFYQDGESDIYRDYGMNRKVLRWDVPVIAGKTLGRFTPYVGVAYKDFCQTDRLDTETEYVGKAYDLSITDTYHSRSKVHGLAGTTFRLADNIGIGLSATFSRSIAAELTFHLSL